MVREGKIASVIFASPESNYAVLKIETKNDEWVAVGTMPSPAVGSFLRFTGKTTSHPKFGEQFKFDTCSIIVPDSLEGIRSFLGSGEIKGVGPKTADLLVETFGEDIVNTIENGYSKLSTVKGVSLKKARTIHETYKEKKELAEISVFFQNFGISMVVAKKLHDEYGSETKAIVSENPYKLLSNIKGMGFAKVDAIALAMKIDKNDKRRINAGIVDVLYQATKNGDTYMFKEDYENQEGFLISGVLEAAAKRLDVESIQIEEQLIDLIFDGRVRQDTINNKVAIWLNHLYEAEAYCANKLRLLNKSSLSEVVAPLENLIKQTEKDMGITLDGVQKEAILSSVKNGVFVITGGPGTGKSTIVRAILDIFEFDEKSVMVATPTGRAAKRVLELSNFPAQTIHRMLGAQPLGEDDSMFSKNELDPLEYELIIIDEASMIDIQLMEALLRAITVGTRLILVGDADQLPPVGPGNVLNDVIASKEIASCKLQNIYRQAEQSLIIKNAHRINSGKHPVNGTVNSDFFIVENKNADSILHNIVDIITNRLPKAYKGLDNIRDVQIITPTKRGDLGSVNLNTILREALNPTKDDMEFSVMGKSFREGDKVMHISNNYGLEWYDDAMSAEGFGVFNGDIGFVHSINTFQEEITVLYDETKFVTYDKKEAEALEFAYAITIHKSQGSEFSYVIIPMAAFPPMLAYRNLIYTGVTRGKNMVIIVGQSYWLNRMVDNEMIQDRKSGLAYFLEKKIEGFDREND
jgi:exodeoxyribonuclease V alpha subunit